MFKTFATSVLLFLSLFFASFANGQAVSPTLGRNNIWTGSNTFNGGLHVPALQQCASTQYMAGYDVNFKPICLNFSSTTGAVTTLNGLQNAVAIVNPDGNLSVQVSGQNININCPGCGGSGGTPGGSTGAIQWNNSGFAGTVITGMVKSLGAAGPAMAVPGTDFQLPIIINCGSGIACPQTGSTWNFSLSGSAGTGDVASSNFGQVNGNLANNGGTTTSGVPGLYFVNGAWSLAQMNALLSRFNTTPISAWAVSGSNVIFTAANSWSTGDTVVVVGTSESCLNNQFFTVSATGISQTQWEAPNVGSCTGSGTDAGYQTANVPSVGFNTKAIAFVPPFMQDGPSNAWYNTGAQTLDWRKGYAWQQASQYGIKCDAQVLNLSVTSGSNQLFVGSDFTDDPTGRTVVISQQIGYGDSGLQEDWEPTITSFNSGTSYATLSSNAPFSHSGTTIVGTNNQYALTAAFKDLSGIFPLNIPVGCSMLTDTVRWPGTSIIGQQMNGSGFTLFPGHDGLQQQDGIPITAWSINTGTGVTTFTIPAYAAHSIIADNNSYLNVLGDQVILQGFGTSTFFNSAHVQIATQPTPTTFTVNSVFGQSTSSGTEAGLAAPTTAANTNALRVENVSFGVHNGINPSYPWNHYSPTGTLTVEPPMYRPLALFNYPSNDPLAPGWGLDAANGVSTTTANSAVICTSTTAIPTTPFVPAGQFPRVPVVGTSITFPYQGVGQFTTTVASTAGSCSAGFTARTLTAALPNNAAFTGTQTEWFTTTTPQTLHVAIPSTITYPHTITLALPIAPQAGWESNVSSHGRIQIGLDQFDYMGNNLTTTNNTSQLVLVGGPTSVNGGAGDAIGSVVFPMNPCSAMYNQPYPVIPSQSSTVATPAYAVYYPSQCGGNAAIELPNADAIAYTPESSGLSVAFFNNVAAGPLTSNSLSNTNNNGSTFLGEQGNNTGYGNTFNNIRVNGLAFGFVQGPSSVNQHGVRVVGPTSTGQTLRDCTFRTGFPIILDGMEQSKIDRCDTYTTEVSPYDGTDVGAATGLYLSYTLSELDGAAITNVAQFGVYDYNDEPENGNHEEILPSVVDDGGNVTYVDSIFEGGFNIFGGAFHILNGTTMALPTFNYGSNNYFGNLSGVSQGYNGTNTYDPTQPLFYNWGNFGTCQASAAQGPKAPCGPNFVQDYNGHDAWASMMGDLVHPAYNILGGMIVPGEWTGMNKNQVFDPTELWWGSHSECALGGAAECVTNQFDGFNGYIYIGPSQRIAAAKYAIKLNVKTSTSMTFNVQIVANNPNSNAYCTPNFNVQTVTLSGTTAWVPNLIPVDLSNLQGCAFEVVFSNGSTTGTLDVGYFNLIPFPSVGASIAPLATPTLHAVCPIAGVFSMDTGGIWICAPTTGVVFGAGTWKYSPAT